MRYLVAVFPDQIPPENKCESGEPVIPAFPIGSSNHFISVGSSGISIYASMRELSVDPDEIVKNLIKDYPGIPREYLEDTLTQTMVVAASLNPENIYRIFITETSAVLHNVKDENELIPIWEDRPASKYI
jgi:hypothetical protein